MDWARIAHSWNRHEWMADHGEWASSQWDDARAERDEARSDLAAALTDAAAAAAAGREVDWYGIEAARDALAACDAEMEGSVEPGVDDYIAEGTIDPDDVADDPGTRVWGDRWQGWDCQEGETIYLAPAEDSDGIRVVHRWWRDAYTSTRHDRDLWRVATVVRDPSGIAEILDAVDRDVARALWDEQCLGEEDIAEIAERLSAERRHDLGLDEYVEETP